MQRLWGSGRVTTVGMSDSGATRPKQPWWPDARPTLNVAAYRGQSRRPVVSIIVRLGQPGVCVVTDTAPRRLVSTRESYTLAPAFAGQRSMGSRIADAG